MSTPFPVGKPVINVVVTGAAGQIGYSLVPMIANGLMLPGQRVQITMLDLPVADKALAAVGMELQDCNFDLVDKVVLSTDAAASFNGADIIIMCGAFPRKEGMERKDLLLKNAEIFKAQGKLLREHAPKHVRVLVVGNPANTNALLLASAAYDKETKAGVHPNQITALTRLDHNRAAAEAKNFLGLAGDELVQNITIWGNHSSTQVPDIATAIVVKASEGGNKGHATKLAERCASDEQRAYFSMGFFPFVQQRGAAVIKARGASSAASAAKAIVDHVRDWIVGTAPGVTVSMAVNSDGNPYKGSGVPEGLVFSFPCVCRHGEWDIVKGVEWSELIKGKIAATAQELSEEKALALTE
jgi:malate dehydrogenase